MLNATKDDVGKRMAVVYIAKKQLAGGEQCKACAAARSARRKTSSAPRPFRACCPGELRVTGLQATGRASWRCCCARARSRHRRRSSSSGRSVRPSARTHRSGGWHALAVGLLLTFVFMAMYDYGHFGCDRQRSAGGQSGADGRLLSMLQASLHCRVSPPSCSISVSRSTPGTSSFTSVSAKSYAPATRRCRQSTRASTKRSRRSQTRT